MTPRGGRSTGYEPDSIHASAAARSEAAKVRTSALTKWLAIFGATASSALSETTAMRRTCRWFRVLPTFVV